MDIRKIWIPRELLTSIREMDGVREVCGRRSAFDVPARLNGNTGFSGTTDLISYDDFDLQCLKKDGALKRGSDLSKVYGDSHFGLATSDQDSTWKIHLCCFGVRCWLCYWLAA